MLHCSKLLSVLKKPCCAASRHGLSYCPVAVTPQCTRNSNRSAGGNSAGVAGKLGITIPAPCSSAMVVAAGACSWCLIPFLNHYCRCCVALPCYSTLVGSAPRH